jgi:hypothetical protein
MGMQIPIPDAEGAEVAQKTQKRQKIVEVNPANLLDFQAFLSSPFFSSSFFSASSAQLLRFLRPVFKCPPSCQF